MGAGRVRGSRVLWRRCCRTSPQRRRRFRVHWLLAQRSRVRNYLRRFAVPEKKQSIKRSNK